MPKYIRCSCGALLTEALIQRGLCQGHRSYNAQEGSNFEAALVKLELVDWFTILDRVPIHSPIYDKARALFSAAQAWDFLGTAPVLGWFLMVRRLNRVKRLLSGESLPTTEVIIEHLAEGFTRNTVQGYGSRPGVR